MNDIKKGYLRHALTAVGGILLSYGFIEESVLPELVGSIITIIGFVMSHKNKK
jgi:hypothetical protein